MYFYVINSAGLARTPTHAMAWLSSQAICVPAMSQTVPVPAPAPVRATFYVDGFNLYHGIDEHSKGRNYKWLDLRSLAKHLLSPGHTLDRVIYFTSVPPWNHAKQERHRTYIAALESVGVEIVEGRFQRDQMTCKGECGQLFSNFVEKLTDVNIATTILRDAVQGRTDWVYLISGDADQAPTIRALRQLAPSCGVHVVFPPRRHSAELDGLADSVTQSLGYKALKANQFPDEIKTQRRTIQKPAAWMASADAGD